MSPQELTLSDVGWFATVMVLAVVLLVLLGSAMSRAVEQRRVREEAAAERDEFGPLPPRVERDDDHRSDRSDWWQS